MRHITGYLAGGLVLGLLSTGAGETPMKVTATDVERSRLYHSPQTPGYTCWVGTWAMPDGALRVAFHQATGPLQGRPSGRKDVLAALGWPPAGIPGYDMTGTLQEVITIESSDAGKTWAPFAAEPFHTPMNGVYSGHTTLADGTVLRTAWGMYLPFYDVPQTGYVQRSVDGGRTWGAPIVLMDPAKTITLPKRTRVLRDGRVLVAGGYIPLSAEVPDLRRGLAHIRAAFWLSKDGGQTWGEPIVPLTKEHSVELTEESDTAELPDGRLLVITRTNVPDRWQTVLRPAGAGYEVESFGKAPFPHSGMPEVLAAREGVVLHLASTGISWTADAGKTWADLGLGTGYYPAAVQLSDGRIFVAAHLGSDDPYDGRCDQSIEGLTFRLKLE
jgi:hypothetical protein